MGCYQKLKQNIYYLILSKISFLLKKEPRRECISHHIRHYMVDGPGLFKLEIFGDVGLAITYNF